MKVIITESQTTTWNLKIPRKKLTAIPSALRGFLLRSSLHDQRNNTKTNILVILIQHTRQTHVTVEAYQCSRLCSMEWPVGVMSVATPLVWMLVCCTYTCTTRNLSGPPNN